MATGTAASRITGQLRTILLVAAIGTTGMAANAYQAGSLIPQSVFTLVSGGIFNAVLVPQIVRTMKQKDAQDRLNRLITLAIGLLLAITVIMATATPLLARLYIGGNDEQMIALTCSFTLWCMPQVFFYGLYTVLGQILAAKDHFVAYAWSSTGANVISCTGFIAFIILFGKANEQPLDFWTPGKIALTAGTWTVGVAFQALILFLPLARIGFKYRPSFGLTGFGLRAMGPVALGSLGVVVVSEISSIVLSRIATQAPQRAHELTGASLFAIAGNATYQNAFTLYVLPYSLIAVSVSTAMFPKISRSLAAHNLDEARHDLGSALNNVGLLLMFFAAALVVYPEPIIRTLLPSVSMDETMLIAHALTALSIGIPFSSAFLLIQRTFYAFEDGLHPFISAVMQYGVVSILMIVSTLILPPEHWVTGIAYSVTIGALLTLPPTLMMLRTRFEGRLGGRAIARTYGKAGTAAILAAVVTWLLKQPVVSLFGADIRSAGGRMSWTAALGICVVLTIALAIVYVAILWILRTPELTAAMKALSARLAAIRPTQRISPLPSEAQAPTAKASPADRIKTQHSLEHQAYGAGRIMKPQLGDTILNRYTLVSPLREGPGIEAWKANDRVLAKDCQLFMASNSRVLGSIDEIAGRIAAARPARHVPVLKYRLQANVLIAITPLDAGLSLTEYLSGVAGSTLSYNAMRAIVGECVDALRPMHTGTPADIIISTDTVRVTSSGVEIADAPFSPLLADTSATNEPEDSVERHAVRQLSALLYAMLTHTPSQVSPSFDLRRLPQDTPGEFRVICKRGLALTKPDEQTLPMASLIELDALLGNWKPLTELADTDIALPNVDGECSIVHAPLAPVDQSDINPIPETLITSKRLPKLDINVAVPVALPAPPAVSLPAPPAVSLPARPAATSGSNGLQEDKTEVFLPTAAEGSSAGASGAGASGASGAGAGAASAAGAYGALGTNADQQDARHLFDFRFSDAWEHENLSGEDTGDWFNAFGPAPQAAAVGNSRLTVPIPRGNVTEPAVGETTSRIPIFDTNGREIAPGEESRRALEEEQARIAEISAVPPSFIPTDLPNKAEDDKLPDEHLFGSFTTKVVAIVVALLVVAAATVWAVNAFRNSGNNPSDPVGNSTSEGEWPQVDMDDVPFGGDSSTGSNSSGSNNSDAKDGGSDSGSSDASGSSNSSDSADSSNDSGSAATDSKKTKKTTADKQANAVPQPRHENNTAYTISSANFLSNPGGQSGYAYHVYLDQQHEVYRMTVTIRTSGGKGYIRTNTTGDPTQGEQVAEFAFAEGGTTEVKFTKVTTAQDLILWVPSDSMPQNQLYIEKIEVF
jgi:putative peptidoglycan lipid II flippase